ncbi:MAG: hypothetical protein WCW16_00975 [Candidatus Magasanikbacteria bacterium]
MRQEIDKIEIKEPPLEELNKKRSCLKRTCLTGCGCFTILFIISLLIIKFTMGPQAKQLRELPNTFIKTIPIYDKDNVETITHTSGKERGRGVEAAAYIPKLIISPVVIFLDTEHKYVPVLYTEEPGMTNWQKFIAFMARPIADHRDVFKLEWLNLSASQNFILEYYQKELEKNGFTIMNVSETDTIKQFTFSKDKTDGVLYTMDNKETKFTDYISLTVNIPIE